MISEFETKKIPFETLGEYLSSVRKDHNLTIEEVSHKTGVFEKFISYLEQGKYNLLPPEVYVIGFLKKISVIYKISSDDLIAQYKKEKGLLTVSIVESQDLIPRLKKYFTELTITPKNISIISALVLLVLFVGYVVVQIMSVNKTPKLEVYQPSSNTVIEGSTIMLKGKTDSGITLSVNGQNVFVNKDGTFEQQLGVVPGQKEFSITAKNKFGKTRKETISLRVEEPRVAGAVTAQEPVQEKTSPSLKLELKFKKDSQLIYTSDNNSDQKEDVNAGTSKVIEAQNDISITTSDAGSVEAVLNGKPFGVLGKHGQKLTIPFNLNSKNIISK